jgi:hypothetical protein
VGSSHSEYHISTALERYGGEVERYGGPGGLK